ncbi:MAG: response regulator [Chthoniobacterales bacterium]|jgi:CheY-like chemotaxis protein
MKILLVEDHGDTRSTLERIMGRWGHDVEAAPDLRSGLTHLARDGFDAIVSDIALPDGTGYALISEARRSGSTHAVAIAISAYPFPNEAHEANVTGFDHHLSKPFSARHLRRLLENKDSAEDDPSANIGTPSLN